MPRRRGGAEGEVGDPVAKMGFRKIDRDDHSWVMRPPPGMSRDDHVLAITEATQNPAGNWGLLLALLAIASLLGFGLTMSAQAGVAITIGWLLPTAVTVGIVRSRARMKQSIRKYGGDICDACGYPLKEVRSFGRCPECGKLVSQMTELGSARIDYPACLSVDVIAMIVKLFAMRDRERARQICLARAEGYRLANGHEPDSDLVLEAVEASDGDLRKLAEALEAEFSVTDPDLQA